MMPLAEDTGLGAADICTKIEEAFLSGKCAELTEAQRHLFAEGIRLVARDIALFRDALLRRTEPKPISHPPKRKPIGNIYPLQPEDPRFEGGAV